MHERVLSKHLVVPGLCLSLFALLGSAGAFSGGLWASVGIGGACLLALSTFVVEKKFPWPEKGVVFFILTVLIVFALELPFSSHGDVATKMWLRLASIFLPLSLLASKRVQRLSYSSAFFSSVAMITALGSTALGLELQSGGVFLHTLRGAHAELTEYNRGIAQLVIFAFALCGGLWILGAPKSALVLAFLVLFPACFSESHTAKLALFLGALVTSSAFFSLNGIKRVLVAICLGLTGWPFYAQLVFAKDMSLVERLHNSWRHRIEIWDYLSYRILERPFLGWGLNTTQTLDFQTPHGSLYLFAVKPAPHAHNFVVQLWVETGIVGLLLGVALLLLTLHSISNLHRSLQPFALGCFASALAVSSFGFDLWTDALWSAFALSAFAFGMIDQQLQRRENVIDAKII